MASDNPDKEHNIENAHRQPLLTLIESFQHELRHLHEALEQGKELSYSGLAKRCRILEQRLHYLGQACAKKDLKEYVDSHVPAIASENNAESDPPVPLKGLSDPHAAIEDITLYRHHLSEIGFIVSFVVLSVLAFVYTGKYEWSVQYIPFGELFVVPIPFFALVPVTIAAFIVHRLYDCRYVISHDHVRAVSGLLSFAVRDIRVDYENVRGIQVDKTIVQRVLCVGDVYVGSSMHADVEIVMRGVLHPRHVREEIEERIKHHFARLSRNTVVERVRSIGSESATQSTEQ